MSIHDIPDEMNFLTDQKEVLMEKHDMTEEEAEAAYDQVKMQVMMMAQSADRDWDKAEYEAATDVLLGLQTQQMEMMENMEGSRIRKVARFLPLLMITAGGSLALSMIWISLFNGPVNSLFIAGFYATCVFALAQTVMP